MSKTLNVLRPNVAALWHPTKNGDLKPSDVTLGSEKRVWWQCSVAPDHEWPAEVYRVVNANNKGNTGCPYCRGFKVTTSNCLASLRPDVAVLWHPTKNNGLTAFDVSVKSNRKVWWKCAIGDDHEWFALIKDVVHSVDNKHNGCACCHGKRVVASNCLATVYPEVAKLWHPTKNGSLLPTMVVAHSGKRVWWKCFVAPDHEWYESVNCVARSFLTGNTGCSCCAGRKVVASNCLATLHPDIAKLWHSTRNTLTATQVTTYSNKKVWWECPVAEDHVWFAAPATVVGCTNENTNGCPYCAGKRVVESNCLAALRPNIVALWHPTKNNIKPTQVTEHSSKKVWWQCDINKKHIWRTSVAHMVRSADEYFTNGCPYCRSSRGEKLIKTYLHQNNIIFQAEHRIPACKYKKVLPFDLAIFDNSQLCGLIEFQGKQHYEPIEFFGGEAHFKQQQHRDNIKRTYCQTHDIPLLEIPHWLSDDEIIEKLSQFIQKVPCDASTKELEPQKMDEKSYALCASA